MAQHPSLTARLLIRICIWKENSLHKDNKSPGSFDVKEIKGHSDNCDICSENDDIDGEDDND